MARDYMVNSGAIALAAATAKTVVELLTPAGVSADVVQVSVTFDASTAGAGIVVELCRGAATGTGTAQTPARYNDAAQMIAPSTAAKVNDTVEPATLTVIESYFVPNTAGLFWQLPLGRELVIAPATLLSLRVTSAVVVNVRANVIFEE